MHSLLLCVETGDATHAYKICNIRMFNLWCLRLIYSVFLLLTVSVLETLLSSRAGPWGLWYSVEHICYLPGSLFLLSSLFSLLSLSSLLSLLFSLPSLFFSLYTFFLCRPISGCLFRYLHVYFTKYLSFGQVGINRFPLEIVYLVQSRCRCPSVAWAVLSDFFLCLIY